MYLLDLTLIDLSTLDFVIVSNLILDLVVLGFFTMNCQSVDFTMCLPAVDLSLMSLIILMS